jgi:hypothetical protein
MVREREFYQKRRRIRVGRLLNILYELAKYKVSYYG